MKEPNKRNVGRHVIFKKIRGVQDSKQERFADKSCQRL